MKSKKNFLLLISIFVFGFGNVHACSLNNLTSCSFSDLTQIVSDFMSLGKQEPKSHCPKVYAPVCGKKGTYENICFLKEKNDRLIELGACQSYPYNLSANKCVKNDFKWNGYKCLKEEDPIFYVKKDLGISLELPENSKINDNYIELPKERSDTNLILKKLKIISGNNCSDIALYTKVTKQEEKNINGNIFRITEGKNDLDYGKDVLIDVDYRNYVLESENTCTGFLFSIYSQKDSPYVKYDKNVESSVFDDIIKSFSFTFKQNRQSPCENYGDLNADNVIDEKDLEYFKFGSIESNNQKKGDLNADNVIDEKDEIILKTFILGDLDSFEACSLKEEVKTGGEPQVIFNNNIDIVQNRAKTETSIRINFDLTAKDKGVYIPASLEKGMPLKILNNEIIEVADLTWNTGAQITEDGYIFLKKGESAWVSLDFNLKAKQKPVYTRAIIDKINYIDNKGELKSVSLPIKSKRIYLNYKKSGNLVCGDYGDINGDGFIKKDDVSYIVTAKELDEDQKRRADVSGNGEVNLIDAIELQKYILEGDVFTVCSKTFKPKIYESPLMSVEKNEDRSNHVFITFYLDSNKGDAFIPAKVSLNQDNDSAGIYLETKKDGNIIVKNLKLYSSAEPTNNGFLRLKKGLPQWIKIEFDVEAIKDTALVDFKINKVAYLTQEGKDYLYPENIETGDMFLNYKEEQLLSPCENMGDLDSDGFVTYLDYDYLKNNLNLLLKNKDKFIYADLNKDGKIDNLDLEELNDFLTGKINNFSGCFKSGCSDNMEVVYTKDGFIYANECYLIDKQVKCYIDNEKEPFCGL